MIRLDHAAWILAGLALAATGLLARSAGAELERPWVVPPAGSGRASTQSDIGDVARQVVASDPFRFDRRPAEIPFGSSPPAPLIESAMARPPQVTGILGPPWRAALEGIAGREGPRLVAAGDTLAGWRVLTVHPDTVVIQSRDTTWRLPVRRP